MEANNKMYNFNCEQDSKKDDNDSRKKVFVYGFPSKYGGAGTELHHQIIVWLKLNLHVNIIPTHSGYKNEELYGEMINIGVTVHKEHDFSVLKEGDPILGFCNSEFLDNLPEIAKHTTNTIFVNCMTWLFDMEKKRMKEGLIRCFLYQNEEVRLNNMPILRKINDDSQIKFITFKAYFDNQKFPFISERSSDFFGCGRISRQDLDKFASNTLHIYEYFVSPKFKKAKFLGFNSKCIEKIGKPYDWIETYVDQRHGCTQNQFYQHCEIVLQPTDTTENWPRIGFEAMSSGSVLIVDNRGGWRQMVEHGKTGWLCNHERDFIYYASKMAYEPNLRNEMALAARERSLILGGLEESKQSWKEILC